MKSPVLVLVALSALAAACSSGDDEKKTDLLAVPAADVGLQLVQQYGPLAPGSEVHYCQLYQLPATPIDVSRFEHAYTSGGHHVILYPTDLTATDLAANPGVFDCDTVMPNRGNIGFGYVGGSTHGEVSYPAGVAWHFDAGQIVLLESHMLNPGSDPLNVDYRLNLYYATGTVTDHVGTIFFYDNQIYIPAAGSVTARQICNVPQDIQVTALAPHMHIRGTHMEASLVGGSLTAPMPLVASDDWANVDATRWDPPLAVTTGQQFDVSCDYVNPDAMPIVSGPSKTQNEMCLLIGSYYPRIDFPFEFCMTPGSGPLYTGTQTCSETFTCFIQAGDPFSVASQECVTKTCPKSGQAFNDFFSCVGQKCFFPDGRCGKGDPTCNACAAQNCAAELNACQAAACQ